MSRFARGSQRRSRELWLLNVRDVKGATRRQYGDERSASNVLSGQTRRIDVLVFYLMRVGEMAAKLPLQTRGLANSKP